MDVSLFLLLFFVVNVFKRGDMGMGEDILVRTVLRTGTSSLASGVKLHLAYNSENTKYYRKQSTAFQEFGRNLSII